MSLFVHTFRAIKVTVSDFDGLDCVIDDFIIKACAARFVVGRTQAVGELLMRQHEQSHWSKPADLQRVCS